MLQAVDSGGDLPDAQDPQSITAICTALMQLLTCMSEPPVPFAEQERCANVQSREEAFEVGLSHTSDTNFESYSRDHLDSV